MDQTPKHILLYDGVCNLCAHTVKFTVANDPDYKISFASLQSNFAKPFLKAGNISDADKLRSVVFVDEGNVYTHSTAILRMAVVLGGVLGFLASIAFLVPQVIRDFVYDIVGGNRYLLFGILSQEEACMMLTPSLKRRFLDWDEQFGNAKKRGEPRKSDNVDSESGSDAEQEGTGDSYGARSPSPGGVAGYLSKRKGRYARSGSR